MATRGSFQKHQKEQARKERRQQKLARRQGRSAGPGHNADSAVKSEATEPENSEQAESSALTPGDRAESLP